ncbi:MAG: 2-aminoethylphosphonate--pyruvate transaminase [Thermodesulfobacteriota bacterium]|nr:2-aminoethylphosphonate--pyruvate transaminase [Thermodesulfobacteriota bacterium]
MGLNIKRNILLNPGPATTTDSVKLSLVVPDICPREKDFSIIMEEVRRGLLEVVGADERYACVLFSGSGTAVMDATINSTIKPGKRVLIINNGAYGERMVKIAEAYGIGFLELSFRWTDPPDLLLLEKVLIENKDVTHVAMVHHETSTGMLNPLEDVCAIAKRLGREVIIDAISSYAGIPIDVKRHEIDYIMSTSNKCIQGMAGLSFVIARKEPLDKLSEIPPRSFYLNLYRQYRYWEEKREMTFTPPVQLVYALRQALKEYFEEGGGIFRHRRYSENWHTLTDGLRKLGFRFLLPEGLQSRILTTVYFPASPYFSFEKLHDMLYQRGFTIYPGKISKMDTFRIANMGAIDKGDVINFLNALEETLGQMGITMPMEALH